MNNLEFLKSIMRYNPEDGKFLATSNRGPSRIGEEKGWVDHYGYRMIQVKGKTYKAHRLAFAFMGQDIPKFVDHINGERSDNRWLNLRPATRSQNMQNQRKRSDNISGVKGAHWCKTNKKWVAQISINGSRKFIGYFPDLIGAELAVRKVRDGLHMEYANHG